MYVFQRLLGEPEPGAGVNRDQTELGRQFRRQRTFPGITVAVTLRGKQPGVWVELAYGSLSRIGPVDVLSVEQAIRPNIVPQLKPPNATIAALPQATHKPCAFARPTTPTVNTT